MFEEGRHVFPQLDLSYSSGSEDLIAYYLDKRQQMSALVLTHLRKLDVRSHLDVLCSGGPQQVR